MAEWIVDGNGNRRAGTVTGEIVRYFGEARLRIRIVRVTRVTAPIRIAERIAKWISDRHTVIPNVEASRNKFLREQFITAHPRRDAHFDVGAPGILRIIRQIPLVE